MGVADRLRSWARNPWLVAGTIVGVLLLVAWIGWAIHVWNEHGAREAVGALIAWAAIVAIIAAIVLSLVAVYQLLRPRVPSGGAEAEDQERPAEREATGSDDGEPEPEAEAAPG
ncbi:MAG TPA: hypothetical protein VFN72_09625 [Solirubrobacterales bacterium]|nr:hypothetical protein [Solirubrobacterales bacterium]